MTQQELSRDLVGTTSAAHLVSDPWSRDLIVVDSCPSTTLLNKVLEAVPSTQGLDRIQQKQL